MAAIISSCQFLTPKKLATMSQYLLLQRPSQMKYKKVQHVNGFKIQLTLILLLTEYKKSLKIDFADRDLGLVIIDNSLAQ